MFWGLIQYIDELNMINMNNLFSSFIFKHSLFVLSILLLLSCGGDGDNPENKDDTIGPLPDRIIGTIAGNLQDNNGNPLSDVTLYTGGKITKSDALGNYRFDNVGALNAGIPDNSNTGHLDFIVNIPPTDGYLGASISISPAADINNPNEVESNTFVDGFIISTSTTILPTLTQAVSGVLINSQTGEAISGATVELEFINLFEEADAVNSVGLSTQYQTLSYTAVADINGNFSISDLPDDSSFIFKVEGYEVVGVDSTQPVQNLIDTYDRIIPDVGTLLATPGANDVTPPYVVSVNDILDQTASTGVLSEGFDSTQGIVINFSETIPSTEISVNSVSIFDTTNISFIDITNVTVADDGLSMVITTSVPIENNVTFDINMQSIDFQDLSGNIINTAPAGTLDNIAYDDLSGGIYRLTLKTFP